MELSLDKIAEFVAGELEGEAAKRICDVAPFEHATADEITFAGAPKFIKRIEETSAGAIIVPLHVQAPGKNVIRVKNPHVSFTKVMGLFHPPDRPRPAVSAHARIGDNFVHGVDAAIAPGVVIGKNVVIGDRVILHPNVVLGDAVVLGDEVVIYPNVTVRERCRIGSRVIIHAGSVIGSDGFGFAFDGDVYHKIPHIGIVQIDDDVEIGAGNTVDRATFGKTWIKKGVKTDNLVHVGHNVVVGENTLLVAQVGISGSVTIGKHAILAGQAGVAEHLSIGDHAIVGPQAGVGRSVAAGEIVSGAPEMPHQRWLRVQSIVPRLPELKKHLADLERRLSRIEKGSAQE